MSYAGWRGFAGYGTPRDVSGYDIVGDDGPSNDTPPPATAALMKRMAYQGNGDSGAWHPRARPMFGAPSSEQQIVTTSTGIARRLALPFPGVTRVAATSTVTLRLQPQRPIRVERLLIEQFPAVAMPSQNEPLLLAAFNVGAEPIFVSDGRIPCVAFRSTAVGQVLRGYTAPPGITITLTIENVSPDPWDFAGTLIGEALGAIGY